MPPSPNLAQQAAAAVLGPGAAVLVLKQDLLTNHHHLLSLTLSKSGTTDPHGNNTYWLIHRSQKNIGPELLQESLRIRFERRGWVYNNDNNSGRHLLTETSNIRETREKNMENVYKVMEEDNWKIFYWDGSDRNTIGGIEQMFRKNYVPCVGWKYLYFFTPSVTSSPFRNMKKYKGLPWNTTFGDRDLGGLQNFTNSLGKYYAGVKHYTYFVRGDLLRELNSEFQKKQNLSSSTTTPFEQGRDGGGGSGYPLNESSNSQLKNGKDPIVYSLHRPIDVATFWKPTETGNGAFLRSAVSTAVQSLSMLESNTNNRKTITTKTSESGKRGPTGRRNVQLPYVQDLLNIKIYVLCQRNAWEDHIRLFEAMVSGALVLTDPMRYFPTGLVDGKTLVVYNSIKDMQNKVRYYLEHNEERLAIAQQGREVALSLHTFSHRIENLLLGDWSVRDEYGISTIH